MTFTQTHLCFILLLLFFIADITVLNCVLLLRSRRGAQLKGLFE